MSIPSFYLTTMAWEKFVAKHDAFMRNFKTKVKNEKRKKKKTKYKNKPFHDPQYQQDSNKIR